MKGLTRIYLCKLAQSLLDSIASTFFQLRVITEKMQDCLKESGEARKYAISLQNLEYTGDLASKLMNFSAKMETTYQKLADLISRKVQDSQQYVKYLEIIEDKLNWYEKAKVWINPGGWGCHLCR